MPESYWERTCQTLERFSFPIFLIVVLITLILIFVFFPNNPVDQNILRFEFVKLLIQLLLISLFGAIFGGIFLQEYNRRRERNLALNEFRKKLFADLTNSYLKVKKVRRILHGNFIKDEKGNRKEISYKEYETQIKEIIDAQLEFEFYHHLLKFESQRHQHNAIPHIFSDKTTKDLVVLTRKIEDNLNKKIIKEYKGKSPSTERLNIAQLPGLNEFIDTKTFKENFSKDAHEALELIQMEIF